jgi:hypothetical protein
MRFRSFVFVSFVALVSLVGGCAGGGRDGVAITGTPAPPTTVPFAVVGDDLYAPPQPLPDGSHGDLIWAEPVDDWWGAPRRAWRVLYRSEAIDGRPIAVSGYVIAPPGETGEGDAERPVIAWAHETLGSADRCAPSRSFDTVQRTDAAGVVVQAQLTALVDGGAVVVATDYEGLGTPGPHPFLVGESAGRSVLDAVRAAHELPGSGAGSEVLVYGVSQGGHAALWAGELASTWSPELDLLGVVAAAPFSEVDQLLPAAAFLPGGQGYLALGVYGQAAANPELDPSDVLDPLLTERAALLEEQCGDDVHLAFTQLAAEAGRSLARLDGFERPEWQAQLASIKPGSRATVAPILVVQGDRDLTVPARTTRTLVQRLCARGDTVSTRNFGSSGHVDVVIAADAEVRRFIADRLAGAPEVGSCPAR